MPIQTSCEPSGDGRFIYTTVYHPPNMQPKATHPTHVDPRAIKIGDNVRKTPSSERDDAELRDSIAAFGVISPVACAFDGKDYRLIAGWRRTTMAIAAELPLIPMHVISVESEDHIRVLQMLENMNRSDMSPADVADGVWDLYDGAAGGSVAIVAEMLCKSKSFVSKMLMLAAPGRSHATARKLMSQDKLYDVEMAYTLCQIEALSPVEAEAAATNIAGETRQTLRSRYTRLKAESEKPTGEVHRVDSADDEDVEPLDGKITSIVSIADLDTLVYIKAAVTEHMCGPNQMHNKASALELIERLLEGLESDNGDV